MRNKVGEIFTVVGHKSETLAIDVHFHFERAVCHWETYFLFRSPAKWIGDLFGKKRCGSSKTFLSITRQFICTPNVQSVKRDAARARKKSASSNLVHNLHSEFDPHRHWRRKASVRQYNGAAMISLWFNLWAEQVFILQLANILMHQNSVCIA